MASGWRSTTLRAIRGTEDQSLGILPRNRFDSSGSDFLEAASSFRRPGGVRVFVGGFDIDAFEEGLGETNARVLGEGEGFL